MNAIRTQIPCIRGAPPIRILGWPAREQHSDAGSRLPDQLQGKPDGLSWIVRHKKQFKHTSQENELIFVTVLCLFGCYNVAIRRQKSELTMCLNRHEAERRWFPL